MRYMELPSSEEQNISANLNKSTSRKRILNPQNILKNIHLRNLNSLIFAHLSINSIRNNFDSLVNNSEQEY